MSSPSLHIVNMMLSAGNGGIEQAFLDYCEGLAQRGHKVTPVTLPVAAVNAPLKAMGLTPLHLGNCGEWDLLAMWLFKRHMKRLKPDIILAQTNRAFMLARFGAKEICPLVGVAHNYNKRAKRYSKADAVFATTQDLVRFVAQQQVAQEKIFLIPNMVRVHIFPLRKERGNIPIIGAMGRLVEKKGFDVFIEALQLLHARGFIFKAILGGTGIEKKSLMQRAHAAGLNSVLTFVDWVEDKKAFYTGLDVFCLPSYHEPFGIVLLEAFTYGTPVVSTDSEGPRDIIAPGLDALLVPIGDAGTMADALEQLLSDQKLAAQLAANGFVKAKTQYSIESVSERIELAAIKICARWKAER